MRYSGKDARLICSTGRMVSVTPMGRRDSGLHGASRLMVNWASFCSTPEAGLARYNAKKTSDAHRERQGNILGDMKGTETGKCDQWTPYICLNLTHLYDVIVTAGNSATVITVGPELFQNVHSLFGGLLLNLLWNICDSTIGQKLN